MKTSLSSIIVLLCLALPLLANPKAAEITGKVVGVHDGDTITVLDSVKTQHKIRLNGIDAPEAHQAFGDKSKQALGEIVFRETVSVKVVDKDKYGRTVGDVFVGTNWVNLTMVKAGMAWHYKAYSKSHDLEEAQEHAQDKKLGLWKDKNPIPPWEFRKEEKTK